jgi:tetratricopeptide (TPR) repeat protein
MQALIIAPDGRPARLRLEKTAQKILEPEKKRIDAERKQVMAAYRKLMGKRKVESIDSLYAKAVANYNKKNFLRSYEGIRKVVSVNPDFKNVKFYDDNITEDMRTTAVADTIPDMEKLSYAKGFKAFYFDKNIAEASRQWERVLAINPKRVEVSEYLKNAKTILDAMERDRRIAEITARLAALYGAGEKEYDAKKYVPSIKEWEKVIDLARKESDVPEAPAWEQKARDAIKRSLEEIEKLAARRRAAPKAEEPAKPEAEVVIDEAAANRYYQEGMVAYAQGRLREAVRSWDLALRMNPAHDRARKAKERAEAELAGGR